MYEAVTHGIRIKVEPQYLEEQSSPDDSYFFWAYTIEIANEGNSVVQHKTRHWRITDAHGKTEEVRKRISTDGAEAVASTPAEYAAIVDRDEKRWSALIKKLKLKVE